MEDLGTRVAGILIVLAIVLALWFAVADMMAQAAPPEITGSRVLTIERSDAGELYAALSIVLEAALAPRWSAVVVYDQAATWAPGFVGTPDRHVEWDASLAWRPWDGWSVSVGRRWRVGPPPDYGGPYWYVQLWRGL